MFACVSLLPVAASIMTSKRVRPTINNSTLFERKPQNNFGPCGERGQSKAHSCLSLSLFPSLAIYLIALSLLSSFFQFLCLMTVSYSSRTGSFSRLRLRVRILTMMNIFESISQIKRASSTYSPGFRSNDADPSRNRCQIVSAHVIECQNETAHTRRKP